MLSVHVGDLTVCSVSVIANVSTMCMYKNLSSTIVECTAIQFITVVLVLNLSLLVTPDQIDRAKQIIDKLKFMFQPESFENPGKNSSCVTHIKNSELPST